MIVKLHNQKKFFKNQQELDNELFKDFLETGTIADYELLGDILILDFGGDAHSYQKLQASRKQIINLTDG